MTAPISLNRSRVLSGNTTKNCSRCNENGRCSYTTGANKGRYYDSRHGYYDAGEILW